ncbi:AAA domain-containing protein [Microcoleus sp. herbarium12]|uniref:AAA domain-containing protein n=1 Tax=Microcoleus sp. herbarium12 TaxID=3055437 RepID=UPI002FD02092
MSISLKGEILGGKYDIQAKLGEGGSCIVYLAKKLKSTERYAIKTLSTEEENAIKLLERETKTLKRLNHPNIVKFIEEGYEDRHKLVYLVLEYLDGQNIKDYFDSGIDLKTQLDIFLQIIDGISHAHSKDIIHRDIKPDNIKIVDTGEKPVAKILDFGIAIITTTILTNTIRSYHTPLFSAPEQINLERVSRDSDIYSLGMTFLYLLSSQKSRIDFQEERDKTFLYKSAEEILAGSNASSLIDLFQKATDKDREKRPKIDEIRKAIANLKEELAERMTVKFSLTSSFQEQISNKYNFQKQIVKIKRHIESELKADSGVLYINKSPKQIKEDRLTVQIVIESLSKIYHGFINRNNPNEVVLFNEPNFISSKTQEIIIENGVAVKVDPIVNLGDSPKRKTDLLSELVNLILGKDQEVQNENSNSDALKLTFEQWQDLIELEKKIISDKKQIFNYQQKYYDSERQLLILTLKEPISLEQFDQITSPPLPVTISVKSTSPKPKHKKIGDIIDGEKGSQGESIAKLHISIGDFCDPEVLASILDKGTIETNFKAQESEVERRRKALREIRHGDSENAELSKVIVDPTNVKQIEPLLIHRFFNEKLDESQQLAVCKALATEDIFLIQGPPGTGKTSVITEIILQILDKYPNDKILISSQSNVAVDNVLTRLSRVASKEIKCVRIGREEKIEEDARQFEIEKAILNWQKLIQSKSLAYWENYQQQNEQLLSGVKKIANIEQIKEQNQELQGLTKKLTQVIERLNSELVISKDNSASQEFSDISLEMIYEKLLLEQKILESIEKYVAKFGIEYPEQKQLNDWINEEYKGLQNILGDNRENHERYIKLKKLNEDWNERLKRKQQDLISFFIEGVNVVGATCLGVANFKDRNFDWVIVDEAGRSTAPETFVPISKGKKIILVGDHKQLPPIIDQELQEKALNEKEIQKKSLEISLFEYLYENLPKTNKITLNHQYRMHPDIGNLVSHLFYEDQVSSQRVNQDEKQHQLKQFDKNVYWISTSDVPIKESQERENGKSRSNPYEAKVIKAVLLKIQQDCEDHDLSKEVGVIAAYRSQIAILESSIAPNDQQLWKNLHISIHTVDAFQGGECDIILYDLVRNNPEKKLGFTADDRRLNVALSRTRQLLIIVGNDNMAYEGRTPNGIPNPFKPLIEYIDEKSAFCSRITSGKFL